MLFSCNTCAVQGELLYVGVAFDLMSRVFVVWWISLYVNWSKQSREVFLEKAIDMYSNSALFKYCSQ